LFAAMRCFVCSDALYCLQRCAVVFACSTAWLRCEVRPSVVADGAAGLPGGGQGPLSLPSVPLKRTATTMDIARPAATGCDGRHVATCCDMTCCDMLRNVATCCDMTCCDMLRHVAPCCAML
jgi:hypothetical protein